MELTTRQLSFLQSELQERVLEGDQEIARIASDILESVEGELSELQSSSQESTTSAGCGESITDDQTVLIIDRRSRAGNLIARFDSCTHIRDVEVDGRMPKPGERWRVAKIDSDTGYTVMEPIEYLETIEDYIPWAGASKRLPSALKFIDKDTETNESQDQVASGNYRITGGHPKDSVVGKKNGLLSGGKP